MSVSRKCNLCGIHIHADEESGLDSAVALHKQGERHSGLKRERQERKEEKRAEKRERLKSKYFPNL